MDTFTEKERSRIMAKIRFKDTKPEKVIRSLVHRIGYRFRLHRSDLPGKPDLVFPGRKKVIFVHGCFWHGHTCKRGGRQPKSNVEYWSAKIGKNRKRDSEHRKAYKKIGWQGLTIWECQIKKDNLENLEKKIVKFLE